MPFNNITNKHFDSGDYPQAMRRALAAIDVPRARARQAAGEPDGRRVGVGLAIYCEQAAHGTSVYSGWGIPMIPGHEQATARLTPDGGLELRVGVHSHGQGLETTLAQVAHEMLGVPAARVRVIHGDTAMTPYSTGTWGSRCMVMAGGAVATACRELADRALRIGAFLLQVDQTQVKLDRGRVVGPAGDIALTEIARTWYRVPQNLPADVHGGGLEVTAGYKPQRDSGTFSYAAHAVVVAVDPELGEVEILDYAICEDGGVLVNPMIVDGQIYGGLAQGIGTALLEEMPFRPAGAAARLDARRLSAAGRTRRSGRAHRPYGDAIALYAVRREGDRRGRGDRAAGRDRQRDQRRVASARRRGDALARKPAADRRGCACGARVRRAGHRMKPVRFDYARPRNLADAIDLLATERGITKVMAGGQSLGPMLNLRLVEPDLIVDIAALAELRGASIEKDALVLGACVTHADIEDGRVPDLTRGAAARIAGAIAYRAIRNRGTIGGSLAHADPAADWITALITWGAEVAHAARTARRRLGLAVFVYGALADAQHPGELLVAVRIPATPPHALFGYVKHCRKVGEFAHAIGSVVLDPVTGDGRAVIGAIEAPPLQWADARPLFGGRITSDFATRFDPRAADTALIAAGIADAADRHQHITVLRRAVMQAGAITAAAAA